MTGIDVVLADDQPVIRRGFRAMLGTDPSITVVGEAADGVALLDAVRRHRPDVAIVDVRMPRLNGLAALERMAAERLLIRTRIIVLTTFDLDEYVERALRAGASGFLLKTVTMEELVAAVSVVAAGDALLAPSATRRLLDRYLTRPPRAEAAGDPRLDLLTARETEVLRLLATGRSNAEIASELFVTEHTVKTHVGRILQKTGVRDRTQAVVLAYDTGLVRPPPAAADTPGSTRRPGGPQPPRNPPDCRRHSCA